MKLMLISAFLLGFANSFSQKSNFFNYDEIEHYNVVCPDTVLYNIHNKEKESRSEYERLLSKTLENKKYPSSLTSEYLQSLSQLGFTMNVITKEKFLPIQRIFLKKPRRVSLYHMCTHVFRDILIFKKDKEPRVLVRICFSCHENHIVSKEGIDVRKLGRNVDYKKLEAILKN